MRDDGYGYRFLDVSIDEATRVVTLTIKGPDSDPPADAEAARAQGVEFWPLQMARELEDAILMLRTNHDSMGMWHLKTEGDAEKVLAYDALLADAVEDDWFIRETVGFLRRTLQRVDVTSRSLFAIIDEGSCFAGTLFEVALAADRSYMLELPDDPDAAPTIRLSAMNFAHLVGVDDRTRLENRFYEDAERIDALKARIGEAMDAPAAEEAGLVTFAPDDLDWADEIRIATEERASLSPDALTGMEANLRFPTKETMLTRVFGRLSAWQNWIFIRPNAVGDKGALKLFGSGSKADFDWKRV
jgi:benzoyl-CoA-dihydrodiol lyase